MGYRGAWCSKAEGECIHEHTNLLTTRQRHATNQHSIRHTCQTAVEPSQQLPTTNIIGQCFNTPNILDWWQAKNMQQDSNPLCAPCRLHQRQTDSMQSSNCKGNNHTRVQFYIRQHCYAAIVSTRMTMLCKLECKPDANMCQYPGPVQNCTTASTQQSLPVCCASSSSTNHHTCKSAADQGTACCSTSSIQRCRFTNDTHRALLVGLCCWWQVPLLW